MKNVFFSCLVGVKRERKENGGVGVRGVNFQPGQPIISFQFGKKKGRKMAWRRQLQNYPPIFHHTFI